MPTEREQALRCSLIDQLEHTGAKAQSLTSDIDDLYPQLLAVASSFQSLLMVAWDRLEADSRKYHYEILRDKLGVEPLQFVKDMAAKEGLE